MEVVCNIIQRYIREYALATTPKPQHTMIPETGESEKKRSNSLGVVEDPVDQGQLAANLALIQFRGGEVMGLSKCFRHVVRTPDKNNVNNGQAGECAEDRGHRNVVS